MVELLIKSDRFVICADFDGQAAGIGLKPQPRLLGRFHKAGVRLRGLCVLYLQRRACCSARLAAADEKEQIGHQRHAQQQQHAQPQAGRCTAAGTAAAPPPPRDHGGFRESSAGVANFLDQLQLGER